MVARNFCLMKLRDEKKKHHKELNENLPASEDFFAKDYFLEKDTLLSAMEASINDLNKEQKTCLTLFYLQKKTYNEISLQTGFSAMQVKSYIQNGKRNLKILVEKKLHN